MATASRCDDAFITCGLGSFSISTLILSLIERINSLVIAGTCNGIKINIKTADSTCTPYVCTSMLEIEQLLKSSISIGQDGTATLNVIIDAVTTHDPLPCRTGISAVKEFANCFVKTSDGQTALLLFNNSCSPE